MKVKICVVSLIDLIIGSFFNWMFKILLFSGKKFTQLLHKNVQGNFEYNLILKFNIEPLSALHAMSFKYFKNVHHVL